MGAGEQKIDPSGIITAELESTAHGCSDCSGLAIVSGEAWLEASGVSSDSRPAVRTPPPRVSVGLQHHDRGTLRWADAGQGLTKRNPDCALEQSHVCQAVQQRCSKGVGATGKYDVGFSQPDEIKPIPDRLEAGCQPCVQGHVDALYAEGDRDLAGRRV
jgi:hypothetical protein